MQARRKMNVEPNAVPTKNVIGYRVRTALRNGKDRGPLLLGCKQPALAVSESEGKPTVMTLHMEEPDNPPVQLVQQSISVQCSPSKTDAASQTDLYTSDAAVQ